MKWVMIIGLAAGLLVYGYYKWHNPTYRWHQKLTLVVDTPDGPKTGASVVEVEVQLTPTDWPTGRQGRTALRGEATVVDLGGGRYLFALLSSNGEAFARRVFQERLADAPTDRAGGSDKRYATKARAIARLRESAPVPVAALPRLVSFTDIADPTTVQQVDPDDLSATFGAGYALRAVTLEITTAPVTSGVVEGVLGWLRNLEGGALDGSRISTIEAENRLANDLSRLNFVRDKSF